jgi:hypothetical protein
MKIYREKKYYIYMYGETNQTFNIDFPFRVAEHESTPSIILRNKEKKSEETLASTYTQGEKR